MADADKLVVDNGDTITVRFRNPLKPLKAGARQDPTSVTVRKQIYAAELTAFDDCEPHERSRQALLLLEAIGDLSSIDLKRLTQGDFERTKNVVLGVYFGLLGEADPEGAVRDNGDGTTTVRLVHPVQPADDDDAALPESITWRELYVGDVLQSEKAEGDVAQRILLIANVTELPVSLVRRLDIRDFYRIVGVAQEHEKKSLGTFDASLDG